MDQDYVDKLSDKEKEWLSNFNEEYISGNFNHTGKKLHKSKKAKRECYSRNNSRNRDLYTILRTKGWVSGMPENEGYLDEVHSANPEEALNEMLDIMKKKPCDHVWVVVDDKLPSCAKCGRLSDPSSSSP